MTHPQSRLYAANLPGLVTIAGDLRQGRITARTYCASLLARIHATDAEVKAWAALDDARALALAERCDGRIAGRPGPLHGVPVGMKDIFDTDDLPTEMGSPSFTGHRPEKNAAIVERILAAGGYVLGKTATTEFAFLHPATTRNPWNRAHTPGGSSSGSAAAVAMGQVPVAIGTQTNGSVIRPAAFCGVIGFKPSFDALPIAGALQFSATLDHVGVFARSVGDAAYAFAALLDPQSPVAETESAPRAPRIAYLKNFPWNVAEPDAAAQFERTLGRLSAAGATVREIALPAEFSDANRVLRTIMFREGANSHAKRQAANRHLLSAELNAAIDEGMGISADLYRAAMEKRTALSKIALDLFADCDALASPPAPGAAPRRLDMTGDPSFCTLWSLLGFPAITLPCALSEAGLPFGFQLAARAGGDAHLLRIARWCESRIGFDHSPV